MSAPSPRRRWTPWIAAPLIAAAAGLLGACTAAWWPPGLAAAAVEAGRPHLAILSALVLTALAFVRVHHRVRPASRPGERGRRSLGVAAAAAAVATGLHFAALDAVPFTEPPELGSGPAWRIVHANLGDAPDLPALSGWVNALPPGNRPDAFSFQELKPGQPEAIDAALPDYAAAWSLPRPDSRGGGLWLRDGVETDGLRVRGVPSEASVTVAGAWTAPEARGSRPLAEVTLRNGDRPPLGLVLFSSARPSDAARHAARAAELDRLAALPIEPGLATAWLGDFNAPPWSPALRAAADHADMRLAANSPRTWPDGALLRLGLPIDLCLVSAGVAASAERGPSIGSDHRPLFVRIRPARRHGS